MEFFFGLIYVSLRINKEFLKEGLFFYVKKFEYCFIFLRYIFCYGGFYFKILFCNCF